MDSTATNGSTHSKKEDNPQTSSATKESHTDEQDEYARSRHGRFRFKSSKSRLKRDGSPSSSSHRHSDKDYDEHRHSHHHHHRRHRHHHHGHHRSSKRRKTESSPPPSPPFDPPLSPNTAFRESLFDALADDEGAAFWESIYGQPIHTYAIPSVPKGPNGELERMTDEEYAEYVRARMWERTHEGMMEERERLRREKEKEKRRAEAERRRAEEQLKFERAIEESLRRGEERRRAKAWKAAWEEYQRSWEELNAAVAAKEEPGTSAAAGDGPENKKKPFILRNHLFWPVESGKRRDISREAVAEFMRHAPAAAAASGHADIVATLKTERVRWHPDKMLHRFMVQSRSDISALRLGWDYIKVTGLPSMQ
ncbi:hypothetical protein T310_9548 [Rasamsonia emersonii CBS 393.64]|uniref:Uncharacterized protein n=1 Tax=Rasamsonia emersonii (strain ATCC 16479 / CBS 393.64 / IMI 116815) TaxID=1408163 RepID=A0A0F4YFW4_RASE3|nr:hypothetical protein T310_9548 [Rasamsonia emersonii CBS 393.64]KKA16831.1 hypothetical protein T310_9548 [Rasamsonia emersonii CBS 393.64]